MKYFFLAFGMIVLIIISLAGWRGMRSGQPPLEILPDMDRQPKYKSQVPCGFFADGRIERMPVEGTVPLERPVGNRYFETGKMGDRWGDGIPFDATLAHIERGRERFAINCAVCHGAAGLGNGITREFGMVGMANYHTDRLRNMADGEIFNTITHGKGQMLPYPHIPPEDRWAIIAYIRALQLSQNARLEDVPADQREGLQ